MSSSIPKYIQFNKQRKQFIKNLLNLLNVTEDNNVICFNKTIEENENIKSEIEKMFEDFKKFFSRSNLNLQNPHLNLFKISLKEEGFLLERFDKNSIESDKKKRTRIFYRIIFPNFD